MTRHAGSPVPRPRQAVILTEDTHHDGTAADGSPPRAMLDFHGRPFLAYLVDLIREQGFTDALIVLDELADGVRRYFHDGGGCGLRITYSIAAPEVGSVRHVLAARRHVEERFLLLRAENFWPMLFDRMWSQYLTAGVPALTTVYANRDGYGRDTVCIGPGRRIQAYDPSGGTPGLKGTDIGYAVLDREVLDLLPDSGDYVEDALYRVLARSRRLVAHTTEHRYYGTGPDQLTLTDRFLARTPAVILAREGVLSRRPPPGGYVRGVADFEWLPGALEALRAFRRAGYTLIVISQQPGLSHGEIDISALEQIHALMRTESLAAGGGIDAIYHCPHDQYAGCDCRKPRPGLLFQAQRDFSLDLTRTCVFGDDEGYMQCAEAAGAQGRLVTEHEPLIVHALRMIGQAPGSASASPVEGN